MVVHDDGHDRVASTMQCLVLPCDMSNTSGRGMPDAMRLASKHGSGSG
jgi:hypothetical protein